MTSVLPSYRPSRDGTSVPAVRLKTFLFGPRHNEVYALRVAA